VRGGFLDAFPTLEINGVKHRTGPPTPLALRILAVVPIALVAVGGPFGALIGVVGVAVNMAVARQNSSTPASHGAGGSSDLGLGALLIDAGGSKPAGGGR